MAAKRKRTEVSLDDKYEALQRFGLDRKECSQSELATQLSVSERRKRS